MSARNILLSASSITSNSSFLLQKIIPSYIIQVLKDQQIQLQQSNFDQCSKIQSQQYRFSRVVLIIDDLDILIEDTEETIETTSVSDTERSSSLHAISRAIEFFTSVDRKAMEISATITQTESLSIDQIGETKQYKSHHPPPPFILGLCRTNSSRLPVELVRVGCFEKVMEMPPPSQQQREIIMSSLLESVLETSSRPIYLSTKQDQHLSHRSKNISKYREDNKHLIYQWAVLLAPQTAGCVASDLRRICADALIKAIARHPPSSNFYATETKNDVFQEYLNDNESAPIILTWEDIRESTRNCIPSQLSQMDVSMTRFVGYEDVIGYDGSIDYRKRFEIGWKNFGGYADMKKRIYRSVVGPWRRLTDLNIISVTNSNEKHSKDDYEKPSQYIDTPPPSGVLFHGPSGCGKTFAAHCLASSLGLHIIKVC